MDGILIVDKPQGLTSHDVVDFIRRKFQINKAGHAGTLDPIASGLLVVLLGKFTKMSQRFSAEDKEYEACLTLGTATDSLDAQGKVLKTGPVEDFSLKQIEDAFQKFLGKIRQIPPMFSALKYKGQALYQLARKGIEVKRSPREVQIYKLKITSFHSPHINFIVACSKGTYIRSLCSDIAQGLGCPGHLSALRRIRCGAFNVSQAIAWNELQALTPAQLSKILILR